MLCVTKRSLDLSLIVLFSPIWIPIFILIACWIKLRSPGPIFYKQNRVGMYGEIFSIIKFRTMKVNADTSVHNDYVHKSARNGSSWSKMDDYDNRIIPGCKILRSAGLDELPQLINVINGEMSLVGPRPCIIEEYDLFHDYTRFETLPGLTGWWQVNGKNKTTFDKMVDLDSSYVNNQSVFLDLYIMFLTPMVLIKQVFAPKPKGSSPIVFLKKFDTGFVRR